jgi:DNA-binding NarL/FixJ family response regulator
MKTTLSKRQKQVLKLFLAGYSHQEVCKALGLHTNTISCYKKIIMDKWEVKNMIELTVESIKRGYLEIDTDRTIITD